MPPNKIWTISDFGGTAASGSGSDSPSVRPAAAAASSSDYTVNPPRASSAQQPFPFKCFHIPNLPNEKQVESLLHRVVREFQPILTRRNYNVLSISEMCCCNDGLDFEPTAGGGKRRKRRVMSNNIWGYNQTITGRGRKSHSIHVRLRHPTDHARLLPYEDVAGTLAHELSHCEHGAHNGKFYKLMDGILDEHASLMASQLRTGGAPMAAFTGTGQAVGSSSFAGAGNRLGGGSNNGNAAAANPRDNMRGHTLGGDPTFAAWMTPAEAAVAAAEARRRQQQLRLRGDHCCRPCTINISDDETNEGNDEDRLGATGSNYNNLRAAVVAPADDKRKRRTDENMENEKPSKSNSSGKHVVKAVCIDLTIGDYEECKPAAVFLKPASSRPALQEWTCHQCTFRNRSLALACDMCATERNSHRLTK